jgi:septum site-determining protein MinC
MIENSGSSPVSIKGFGDSLRVTVNAGQPSEIIREELVRAFEKLNHLVKNAKIILDTGRSAGHEDLFKSLSAFLMDKYALASITKAEPAALHAIPPEQHDNQ